MVQLEDFHVKYRPTTLDEVVGQDSVVSSLGDLLKKKKPPHVYMFAGPSGVGKTTLARVVANTLSAEIVEVDAATYSGVSDTRELAEGLYYKSLTGKYGRRLVIMDEAHALSKASWNSLLKIVEEPPAHLYFCFCTTEPEKVIKTIKTRAHNYYLNTVDDEELMTLVSSVAESEGLAIKKKAVDYIARQAEGSPRAALVYLSQVRGISDFDQIKKVVEQASDESAEQVELFRLIVSGKASFEDCVRLLSKMEVKSYESLRIGLLNYVAAVLLNDPRKLHLVAVLDAFRQPTIKSTEKADFLLGLAELTVGSDG